MSCARVESTALLLRGELTSVAMDEAQAHLETCAICFGRLAMAAAALSDGEAPPSQALGPEVVSWLASSGLALAAADPPSSGRQIAGLRFPERMGGRIGPYVLEGILGHGGMGVVYKARHESGGELVALKTVSTPDVGSFESLRQEIRFLKDAHQPGVVRVLDYDLAGGDPWFAMELLEGETLSNFHRTLWGATTPPPSGERPVSRPRAAAGRIEEVLRIYLQLCGPLEFIHRMGIVHCDLKPANVFLRDQQPVLMDFGLIVSARGAVDRESLHPAVRRRGTLPYISPEVISGQIPDARADLYAFGCMLYESLTGRPPFVASSRSELYDLHLHAAHVPASQLASDVPPELDALLNDLLAKAPQDRTGHAYLVAERLIAAGALGSSQAAESSPAYLFRSRIVGRAESLEQVTQALERTKQGSGALVIVEGESGIGKTFLASEIAQRASLLGLRVVTGECQPAAHPSDGAAAALQGIRNFLDVVRDTCRRGGPEMTERLVGASLSVLKQYSPALAGLPGAESYPDPAPLPDTAGRERLLRALLGTLRSFGALRPYVLILDDLQWADELTLALLDLLDPAFFAETPLLLLGTRRSNEGSAAIDRLMQRPFITSVRLDRLAREHTADIIRQMLGVRTPSASLVDFVEAQAEGVPFFVAEYLRTVLADGILSWRDGSWSFDAEARSIDARLRAVPFPRRLKELVRHRLASLSAEATSTLQAAAVLGREFEPALLAQALGELESAVRPAVAEAIAAGILELGREGRPRFTHDKFREAIYGDLRTERRRDLHASVARTLEGSLRNTPELDVYAGELGRHYELAGERSLAIEYFERGGERALLVAADADAIEHFGNATRLEASLSERLPSIRRARWERGVADAKQGLGQANASVQHLTVAAALLGHPVPRTSFFQVVKLTAQLLLQVSRRVFRTRKRIKEPETLARYVEAGRVFERLQRASYYAGQTRPLLLGCITSLNLLEMTGAVRELAIAYINAGAVCGIIPAHKEAERYFALATDALAETPDPASESLLRLMQAVFYQGMGRSELAINMIDSGTAIADLIGFHRRLNECTAVRSGIDIYAGRVDQAASGLSQLEASANVRGDAQMICWASIQRLECLLVRADVDGALAQYRNVTKVLTDARPDQMWGHCLGALALLRAGERQEAARVALQATALALADPPVLLHGINAFDKLCQALFGLTYDDSFAVAERGELRKALRRMLRHLQKTPRLFALARPPVALELGTMEWVRGRHEQALRIWHEGMQRAREMDLPYHEGRLAQALATAAPRAGNAGELRLRISEISERLKLPTGALDGALRLEAVA
jgi:eukaryotic-like serine/threonine-protein kinase